MAIDEFPAPVVITIDDHFTSSLVGHGLEQDALGVEVVFQGAMVIQMVLGQIGEHGRLEGDAVHAVLMQGVGGDFHRHGAAAIRAHGGQMLLNFQGLRRGVSGRDQLAAQVVMNRAKQTAAHLGLIEQVMNQEANGGLAVGARDARDGQVFGRKSMEGGSGERQGHA